MRVYMKANTRNPKQPPRIVELKYWAFNYANYKMLLGIQYACPNQVVDTVNGEKLPLFTLDLEDFRELELINANIN